jgi:hypothetical protein
MTNQLRANLDQLLDTVIETGTSLKILHKGKILSVSLEQSVSKLDSLTPHPDYLLVDPEEIVHIDWSNWTDVDQI